MRLLGIVFGYLVLARVSSGCAVPVVMDGPDATPGWFEEDGAVIDAGTATVDAGEPEDASSHDGTTPVAVGDAGSDSSAPCLCVSSNPCVDLSCSLGSCIPSAKPDGYECGSGLLCVGGACRARECGDGYRERGPAPLREECDDGNHVDGDGCDDACRIEPIVVDLDESGAYETVASTEAAAMGIDGEGRALVVYERRTSEQAALHLLRFSKTGRLLGGPSSALEVVDASFSFAPVVVGLRGGGWVVGWNHLDSGFGYDVAMEHVAPDGTLGDVVFAPADREGQQLGASMAAFGEGFVVAWHRADATSSDPGGGIHARFFDPQMTPLSSDRRLTEDSGGIDADPRVAVSGDTVCVAFTRRSAATSFTPHVFARRFGAGAFLDPIERDVGEGDEPSVANWVDGSFVIARAAFAVDAKGDVVLRIVTTDGNLSSADVPLANEGNVVERSPFVVGGPFGGGLIAYRRELGHRLAPLAPLVLPAEGVAIRTWIESVAISRPTLAASVSGIWVASNYFDASAPTYPLGLRSFSLP